MKKALARSLIVLLFVIQACSVDTFEHKFFSLYGRTPFSEQEDLSIREIILRTEDLNHSELIVEGDIFELDKQVTYLILKDTKESTDKVLVNLTATDARKLAQGMHLRVLGILEQDSSRFPILRAQALHIVDSN